MPGDYYHDLARWEGEGGSHGEFICCDTELAFLKIAIPPRSRQKELPRA